MPKEPKMYLGEVPADVYQRELEAYKERRANSTSKRVRAQFTYNGKNYTIQNAGKDRYQLKRSHERVQKEQVRRGREVGQEIRLTSIEQMMTDNYWEEANRRGLSVDHRIPIKHGGFSNAPWNLGLMEKSINSAKGARLKGDWKYEPFLENAPDATVRFNGAGSLIRNAALLGLVGGVLHAGDAFAAGDTQEGVARLAETAVSEVPVLGDIFQSESTAGADINYPARAAQMKAEGDAAVKRAADARAAGPSRAFCLKSGNICFKAPELGLSEWLTGRYGRQEERAAYNGSKSL